MRGAHGGVKYERKGAGEEPQPIEQEYEDEASTGRARGGRGGGGGGRGRNNRANPNRGPGGKSTTSNGLGASKYAVQPNISAESEFPALPPGLKPTTSSAPAPPKSDTAATAADKRPAQTGRKVSDILGGSGDSGTWADQMDASINASTAAAT